MRWWEAGMPGNDLATASDDAVQPDGERRSILRELLTGTMPADELDRLEIAPGQWYLPGTPP